MRYFWCWLLLLGIVICVVLWTLLWGRAQNKERDVVEWLKSKYNANTPKEVERWANAGKKIKGIEQTLLQLLENPTPEMRSGEDLDTSDVVHALGYVGSSRSVPMLIRVMEDKERQLWDRNFAATALGKLGNAAAFGALCKIVSSGEEEVSLRVNAVLGLEELGDPNAIAVIEEIFDDPAFTENDRRSISIMLEEFRTKLHKE